MGEYILRYRSRNGYTRSRTFTSREAARAFIVKSVGEDCEIGAWIAVAQDGGTVGLIASPNYEPFAVILGREG
jgi:hypothetical protein